METFSIEYALLSVQSALLGVVTSELRAVVIDVDQVIKTLFIRFYYHGDVSEELFELWNCAITEASAHLSPDCMVDDGIERLDYPNKITLNFGRDAYLRKE